MQLTLTTITSLFGIVLLFAIKAQALSCWGPKMDWIGYVPTFPINKFDLVRCNTGLQFCQGGCKHCVNVTGSFVAKSCAGDADRGLNILGIQKDGCKKITMVQNKNYTKWINQSIGKMPNYTLVADFTEACRCSSDGCNGPPIDEQSMRSFLASSGTSRSFKETLAQNTWRFGLSLYIYCMLKFSRKFSF